MVSLLPPFVSVMPLSLDGDASSSPLDVSVMPLSLDGDASSSPLDVSVMPLSLDGDESSTPFMYPSCICPWQGSFLAPFIPVLEW